MISVSYLSRSVRACRVLGIAASLAGCAASTAPTPLTAPNPAPVSGPVSLPGAATQAAASQANDAAQISQRFHALEHEVAALRSDVRVNRGAITRLEQIEDEMRGLTDRMARVRGRVTPPWPPLGPPTPLTSTPTPASPAGRPSAAAVPLAAPVPVTPTVAAKPPQGGKPGGGDAAGSGFGASDFAVALASYRTSGEVARGWMLLLQRHNLVLARLKPRVIALDFGDKSGGVYRLKAGPFRDAKSAEAACVQIKARGGACDVADFSGSPGEEFWMTPDPRPTGTGPDQKSY